MNEKQIGGERDGKIEVKEKEIKNKKDRRERQQRSKVRKRQSTVR